MTQNVCLFFVRYTYNMNSAAVQAPAYVFRKHTAPVNAATLFANDQYLASR